MKDHDVILAATGQSIANNLANFVGPILLFVIGAAAAPHLFGENKSMAKLLGYILIAIVVVMIFFFPQVIKSLAETASGWFA